MPRHLRRWPHILTLWPMLLKIVLRGSPKRRRGNWRTDAIGTCCLLHYVARFKFFVSCFNAFSRVDIRVDVKIPGGVNAYVVDLRGERCECTSVFIQSPFSYKTLDTRLLLKCGKKPTFRLYSEPYFTLMIPLTSLTRIENSIPSHLQKAKSVFSKQRKPCFQRVSLVVIVVTCFFLNLKSYQVGKLGPIQRYRLLP